MKILSVLNTIISLLIVAGVSFVLFMYGGIISSNFEHFANLNMISQDVEAMKAELIADKPSANNSLVVRNGVPFGTVDIEGYVQSIKDSDEVILLFAKNSASDQDIAEFAVPTDGELLSVRLGCDKGVGYFGTPLLNITGDTYEKLSAATDEAPTKIRLAFGYATDETECASNVAAVQIISKTPSASAEETSEADATETEVAE